MIFIPFKTYRIYANTSKSIWFKTTEQKNQYSKQQIAKKSFVLYNKHFPIITLISFKKLRIMIVFQFSSTRLPRFDPLKVPIFVDHIFSRFSLEHLLETSPVEKRFLGERGQMGIGVWSIIELLIGNLFLEKWKKYFWVILVKKI